MICHCDAESFTEVINFFFDGKMFTPNVTGEDQFKIVKEITKASQVYRGQKIQRHTGLITMPPIQVGRANKSLSNSPGGE